MILASVMKKEEHTAVMVSSGAYATENNNQQGISDKIKDRTDWLLQRVRLPADGGKKFCEQIKNHAVTTYGDGSYKQGKATGGTLLFDKNSMQVGIQIDNEIPIDPTDASAYAGELGGIGGMIAATNLLCKRF